MNFLDVRTVLFISVVIDCLCTLFLVFLWLQNRKRYQGIFFWVADFFFQTTGLFLILLRGQIPDWISLVLANTLVIGGAILGFMGLETFLGNKRSQIHNYILLAIFVCIHIYFSFIEPNLAARNINVSLCLFLICFQCAYLLLDRVSPGMGKMTRGTGIVFGGYCLVSLVRLAVIFSNPWVNNDFFTTGFYDMLLILFYQLLVISLSYTLTLMLNNRLLMEIRIEEQKFSKIFRLSPYAITLTRLSDGCILESNEGFLKTTGYRHEEIAGKTTLELGLWANEQDRSRVVHELSENKRVAEVECGFRKKSGETIIGLLSAEIILVNDHPWVVSVIIDISRRKQAEAEREKLLKELKAALSQIKKLSGLLPICSYCKKIRDDKGYWNQIEAYIRDHSEAEFSHGICHDCVQKYYPDL